MPGPFFQPPNAGGLLSNPLLDILMDFFSQSDMPPPINFRQPFGAVPQKRDFEFNSLLPKNIIAPPSRFSRRLRQGGIQRDVPRGGIQTPRPPFSDVSGRKGLLARSL